MASETESNAPSTLASDIADISLGAEDTSQLELPEHDEHSIHHGGKSYKRGKARPAKRRDTSKSPNAWYWKHGEEISEDGRKRWMCEACWEAKSFTHYAHTSNKAITKHLKDEHNITEDGPASAIQLQITPADDSAISIIPSFFNWELLKLRFIEWIVVMNIAFSQVENNWFRRFLAVLSPSLEKWIPRAGNTVRAWIIAEFERRQEDIRKQLQGSKSRVHLSFDLWTSPNNMAFVGVVGHYMSSQYKVETVLLGLRRLRGTHSGQNIAEAVLEVIRTYELAGNQIGWCVLDNASSNDTCVKELLKALNINDTVEHRRLRCLGHVINLAAKAFFFGSDLNSFEEEIGRTQIYEEEAKEREVWRKRGPVGKLHNVIMYILSTPQRREEFEEKVRGEIERQKSHLEATAQPHEDVELVLKHPLSVIRDNSTRWNSIFCMIQRAFLLKDPLDLFIKRAREKPANASPLSEEDELSSHDWNVLARTRDILQPFYDLTLHLQGRASNARYGSIWETLPALDFLLHGLEVKSREYGIEIELMEASKTSKQLGMEKKTARKPTKKGKEAPADIIQISTGINSCWAKLRKYYNLMDKSPVYASAIVLNPEHKLDYFETNWEEQPEWISKAEESVEDLWRTMYKDSVHPAAETTAKNALDPGLFLPAPQKERSDFDQWVSRHKYRRLGLKAKQDEYLQYLETEYFPDQDSEAQSSSQVKSVDLCAFWACHEAQYPSLARMAFDILSIPAMSSECERVFSSAKILLSDRRARMKEDVIEASECLRAWLQAGQCTPS